MSCPDVPIGSFYNVNKSCQVNVGNPPIFQGLKSPQFQELGLLDSPSDVSPSWVCQVRNQYKQRASHSIYHTLTHTQLQRIVEEEDDTEARKKEAIVVAISSYYFWGLTFGADSISEEVTGFSPFMVSPSKNIVFIVSCI